MRQRLCTAVMLLLVPSAVLAQFETASVLGAVRDNTGGIVAGATVTLMNVATGGSSTKTTDANGNFEFFTVPSQPFGNAKRNSVRGPYFRQIDFVAAKQVPLAWRQSTVEIRLEAFNLFNRTNFRPPSGNRSAAAFGTITSAYDPRQLQIGVKINF